MSDHISGPRAIADPVIDITDVYAFPCPEDSRHVVLIMNVFPTPVRPPCIPMRSFTGCACVPYQLCLTSARSLLQTTNALLISRSALHSQCKKATVRCQTATSSHFA